MSDREIRLLLLDDHTSFRELLSLRLAREPDLAVVAEAGSLAKAQEVLRRVAVDIALVDLELPDGSGVQLIHDLRVANPHAQALLLTASVDRHEYAAAVAAGASGVLSKTVGSAEIIATIRRLSAGETLLSPREVIEFFRLANQRREAERSTQGVVGQLTSRERDLLRLLAEGLDDAAIAEQLYISPKTVRNHISNIFLKLRVADRAQAIVRAREAGLGQDGT